MPYDSIEAAKEDGFPTTAENIALTLSQINKLAEIYDAVKEGGTAENAMAVAWTQWKKLYRKEGDKWIEREQESEQTNIRHEAILQTLDRRIDGVCFAKDAFQKNVEDWTGIPVIFGKDHPDLDLYDSDKEKALGAVNGKEVGTIESPEIDITGRPKLKGILNISDTDSEELIDTGKLSLSTAFRAVGTKEDAMITTVRPHHVLIFEESAGDAPPRDLGVAVLNRTAEEWQVFMNVGKIISTKNKNILKTIIDQLTEFYNYITETKEELINRAEEAEMSEEKETIEELEIKNREQGKLIETLQADKKQIETEYAEFKQKVEASEAEALKARRDEQWTEIKNKIAPGYTEKEDDEKALREEWETEPHEFMMRLPDMMQKADPTKEEGSEHVGDPTEDMALANELLEKTGRSW